MHDGPALNLLQRRLEKDLNTGGESSTHGSCAKSPAKKDSNDHSGDYHQK